MPRRDRTIKRAGDVEVLEEEAEVVLDDDEDEDEREEPRRKRRRPRPEREVGGGIADAVAAVNILTVGLAAAQAAGLGYLSFFQSAANAAHNATALTFSNQMLLQASTVTAVRKLYEPAREPATQPNINNDPRRY